MSLIQKSTNDKVQQLYTDIMDSNSGSSSGGDDDDQDDDSESAENDPQKV